MIRERSKCRRLVSRQPGRAAGDHPSTTEEADISQIYGNTLGIKPSQKKALERTYRRRLAPDEVMSPELASHLASVSRELGRQVGVLIDRQGAIDKVIVGDAHQIEIPDVGRLRGGTGRFRGVRLVHTHLRGEPLTSDDLNDLALLRLDLVAMIEAREDGGAGRVEVAHLAPTEETTSSDAPEAEGGDPFVRISAPSVHRLDLDFEQTIRALEEEFSRLTRGGVGRRQQERALVIGASTDDEHFEETLELVRSAGVEASAVVRQKRGRLHPKTVIGSGKLQEAVLEAMRHGAAKAIFDVDLKPAQARAFEDATGLEPVDRTQLILDVFAQRAKSGEGKLQVELAQLKYQLPRLTGRGEAMSRLAGGIGTRGPGETVLEVDRRRIRDRIRSLEKRIEQLSVQRDLRRRRRRDSGVPVLSIVGYTNAGKSTLLNALTHSEIETEDKLFMTLDPTSRRLRFPREGEVVITDTVGFIAELPEDLLAAFRATLEELGDADLLIHVVDAADPHLESKKESVDRVLDDLELGEIPVLLVLNKIDLIPAEEAEKLSSRFDGVAVSAKRGAGLEALVAAAEARLGRGRPLVPSHQESATRAR
ncbi:MAG TPA: GTPase HflX [Thermoanaerobaculia bacterium]|nr:GTPase HflX [Thermoanaerobaculia bacterium]